jgi:hypothetical protein
MAGWEALSLLGTAVRANGPRGLRMPKIVVLNRLHLDEWLSDEVDAILQRVHRDVTCFSRAAPPAGFRKRRGYEGNITDSFPGHPGGTIEQRDAWLISQLCADADLVLDLHGNNDTGNDYPFYGPSPSSPLVRGMASLLGSERAFIHGIPHPAGALPNYVGWDLSRGTAVLGQLAGWLDDLVLGWLPPAVPMREFRMAGGIRAEDARRFRLDPEYRPFTRLPDGAARALGLGVPAYAISWSATAYGHTGYWGEVAVPL